jgi:hypothetical protein
VYATDEVFAPEQIKAKTEELLSLAGDATHGKPWLGISTFSLEKSATILWGIRERRRFFTMSMFGDLFPNLAAPPPVQRGGIQSYKIEMNNLEADVHRSADQTQDVFQGARAFFGANAANTLNQQENLAQEASGLNEKNIVYTPPTPTDEASLERVATALFASRFLARGRADNLQDQIGGQSAVSSGFDDAGNMSDARNELLQEEKTEQVIEDVKVKTFFDLRQAGRSGTRRIDAIFDDQVAESNLLNRQRQGYTTVDPAQKGDTIFDNPSTQFASSDGTISQNNMVQDASSVQRSNSSIENLVDMRRDPDSGGNDDVEVAISLNGDFVDGENDGRTRAVSFIESIQEQALVQQAQAGFDEMGNPTGNGGFSMNNAIQTMDNIQIGDVSHLTDIYI